MFKKTRVKLTLLNATVMFVILVFLGISMYFYLRTEIINQIDNSIQNRARLTPVALTTRLQGGIAAAPIASASFYGTARNAQWVFWDENMRMLGDPDAQLPEAIREQLRGSLGLTRPYSIKHEGEVYRVLNVESPQIIHMQGQTQLERRVGYFQIITNISAEMNMLNTVLGFIIVGVVAAAGISVLAGLYLADRALVPIRSSWDKQRQFVADASHELRTPLAVLQAHTELLIRHPDHTIEQESREISTILKEIRRMKKLVNGLLTLSQTDADAMELQMKPLYLNQLAEQAAKQFAPLASLKTIDLTWQLDEDAVVQGDEERMQQLLMIVLDNAIKYTPENGAIRLECRKSESSVSLVISDSGIGIAAEEIPHIFERFYRGDKVRSRTEAGTGLGLPIAQWIVARHNGKISAESSPGAGTTITIILPRM